MAASLRRSLTASFMTGCFVCGFYMKRKTNTSREGDKNPKKTQERGWKNGPTEDTNTNNDVYVGWEECLRLPKQHACWLDDLRLHLPEEEVSKLKTIPIPNTTADRNASIPYYKLQPRKTLVDKQLHVYVYLDERLDKQMWHHAIECSFNSINEAAPGLYLTITQDKQKATILIAKSAKNLVSSFTQGNIISHKKALIHLGEVVSNNIFIKQYVIIHEILHALGFQHQHQRREAYAFTYDLGCKPDTCSQDILVHPNILGITPFDPNSIMLYKYTDSVIRNTNAPIWKTEMVIWGMSELDKVALNLLYSPVRSSQYRTENTHKIGGTLRESVFSCKRVFHRHDGTQAICDAGNTGGPTCPACRVLKSKRMNEIIKMGKWQGWTGLVYCGKRFGEPDDNYCGPDTGQQCPDCKTVKLYDDNKRSQKVENDRQKTKYGNWKDGLTESGTNYEVYAGWEDCLALTKQHACHLNLLKKKFPEEEVTSLINIPIPYSVADRDAGIPYYKLQPRRTLADKRLLISVYLDKRIDEPTWRSQIEEALKNINSVAPGILLTVTKFPRRNQPLIHIMPLPEKEVSTPIGINEKMVKSGNAKGNIINGHRANIFLGSNPIPDKTDLATHELLHTLGFKHQHQRREAYAFIYEPDIDSRQYLAHPRILGITPFDPNSVMLYNQNSKIKKNNSPVWKTKLDKTNMSELDKVALNLLHPPVRSNNYRPEKFQKIDGIWRETVFSCGRVFRRQDGTEAICDARNNGGPTCPACRVLKSKRLNEIIKMGKWQGWTGLVYCGKQFCEPEEKHDGYCGPNTGQQCPDCKAVKLYRDYKYKRIKKAMFEKWYTGENCPKEPATVFYREMSVY